MDYRKTLEMLRTNVTEERKIFEKKKNKLGSIVLFSAITFILLTIGVPLVISEKLFLTVGYLYISTAFVTMLTFIIASIKSVKNDLKLASIYNKYKEINNLLDIINIENKQNEYTQQENRNETDGIKFAKKIGVVFENKDGYLIFPEDTIHDEKSPTEVYQDIED